MLIPKRQKNTGRMHQANKAKDSRVLAVHLTQWPVSELQMLLICLYRVLDHWFNGCKHGQPSSVMSGLQETI